VPDDETPLYEQICGELLFDPLPEMVVHDDHQVAPVEPGWFLSFDDVDSRTIRDAGAPQ